MFNVGMYKHKSGLIILVNENGDVFIKGDNIPLTVRTSDIFNTENWEEMEGKNGNKKP